MALCSPPCVCASACVYVWLRWEGSQKLYFTWHIIFHIGIYYLPLYVCLGWEGAGGRGRLAGTRQRVTPYNIYIYIYIYTCM
jgi:hypothetical protein